MRTVEEIFPGADGTYGFYAGSYQAMTDEFGVTLVEVTDNDYQGDTRVFIQGSDGRYGHLIYGWGSCSGCDALQGCSSYSDLQDLMDGLHQSIKWFASAQDALDFFEMHDWKGDYSWHADETKQYITEVKDTLRTLIATNDGITFEED